MPSWHVPVTVWQPDEYVALSPAEVQALDRSLPGGGTSTSYRGAEFYATRRLTKTITVEADDAAEAETVARAVMEEAIDAGRFPGWQVSDTGEAISADV
jgi:hypothetical protein